MLSESIGFRCADLNAGNVQKTVGKRVAGSWWWGVASPEVAPGSAGTDKKEFERG